MTTCTYTEITFASDAGHRTVSVEMCLSKVGVSMNVKNDGQLDAQVIVLIKLSSEHASRVGRLEMKARMERLFLHFCDVQNLEISGPGSREAESSWDLALVARGATVDRLEAVMSHPQMVQFLDAVRAESECLKMWIFEALV